MKNKRPVGRPKRCRSVENDPAVIHFKPAGIPLAGLEEVVLSVDELEAIRLGDLEGLYQDQAAGRMNISRQTFGRIISSAHGKVAEALINGKSLKIEGGEIRRPLLREFHCETCSHGWELPFGGGHPPECPACGSPDFHRCGRGSGPCQQPGRRRHQGKEKETQE